MTVIYLIKRKKTINIIEKLKISLTIYEVLTLVFLINASNKRTDYVIQEAGCLWRLDSNNVIDFPLMQIIVNINKQHLNFVKKNFIRNYKTKSWLFKSFYKYLRWKAKNICFKKDKKYFKEK